MTGQVQGLHFTVIVLRPDHMWDGDLRDWFYFAHVNAATVFGAEDLARRKACRADLGDEPFDYAIVAVYHGHLLDVADT